MKAKTLFLTLGAIIGFSTIIYLQSNGVLINWIIAQAVVAASLLWIIYSIAEGRLHAWLYDYKVNDEDKDDINEHPTFILMRICMLIPLAVWVDDLYSVVGMMAFQPFFHNGMLYFSRKDAYGHWLDQSTRAKGLTKFLVPGVRIGLLLAGIAILVARNVFNIGF